jgi:hypothetical protein
MSSWAFALTITLLVATKVATQNYPIPISIDSKNLCGKNCFNCIGTSCKPEACFGNYESVGDRCLRVSEALGKIIQECNVYSVTGSCVTCNMGFYLSGGYCAKCDESCLSCTGNTAALCLVCKDPLMRTGSDVIGGVSGTCNEDCTEENCYLCGGDKGCFMCSPGYGRWKLGTSWTCVKMTGNAMDNCFQSANLLGTLCKECNYLLGYWMRDQLTCSNKAYLMLGIPMMLIALVVGHSVM